MRARWDLLRTFVAAAIAPALLTACLSDDGPDACPGNTVQIGDECVYVGDTRQGGTIQTDALVADTAEGDTSVAPDATVAPDTGPDAAMTDTAPDAAADTQGAPDADATTPGVPDVFVLDAGQVDPAWGGSAGLAAFDSESVPPYGDCTDELAGTETCPSLDWEVVDDAERGSVLEVRYAANAGHAGIVVGPAAAAVDLTAFSGGVLTFDVKVTAPGAAALASGLFVKVESGQGDSGELYVPGLTASGDWESLEVPVATLTASGGLGLSAVTVPLVLFPAMGTAPGVTYRLDNVRFSAVEPKDPPIVLPGLTAFGAGTVSDRFNPAGYGCVFDFGHWIYNAGVVLPGVGSCDPIGAPTPIYPQVVGAAASEPTATHRWWGSVSFSGEMQVGDPNRAGYITPDPMSARISNMGARVMGIPAGLGLTADGFLYQIPDPFAEVFDGVAIGNTAHDALDAYLADHSDGSVTVQWQAGGEPVMEATFVHGSPYAYFKAFEGDLVVRTLRSDGGEKGTFYAQGDALGVWTSVAGNHNNFLIVGEGETTFGGVTGAEITVSNAAKELTLALLPGTSGTPDAATSAFFAARARAVVAAVDIDYAVDRATHSVTVTHTYRDAAGAPVETLAGLPPLAWKRSAQATTPYQVRSARGVIKYSQTSQFSYAIPHVGVLPYLPSTVGGADQATLEALVTEFVSAGPATWNTRTDTYWAGKNYNKVAELAAIARSIGMVAEADQLVAWLEAELSDWFTAATDGALDTVKYFVYDPNWDTLLGVEESFASHQQLNDHHFHYGYFVRAAAEVCRVNPAWCGADQYGPMVELLIRDYAGGRDDPLFPYLRHFDPANGFSWASGAVNFALGNNNESTSEAANAYGAIVLYGLIVGDDALVDRGVYLHASTAATYWEYWNNLDRYRGLSADHDNFPAGYTKLTTSIIWGQGAVFSTWFSPAYAHILGIQGLPANPLTLHVGLHADYMADYVTLGLTESSNGKPSGLADGEWRDIWWSLWAMVDADAALADYATVGSSYEVEDGETRAHTYHWLHAFDGLGHLATGTGALTADHPAAMAFDKGDVRTYVVYNFTAAAQTVSYSDGHTVVAAPHGFTLGTSE